MALESTWTGTGLIQKYVGDITGAELLQESLAVAEDPRFDALRYVITDWSESRDSSVSEEDVLKLAAYIKAMAKTNGRIRHATVLHRADNAQALTSLYVMLASESPWQIAMFHSLAEAQAWVHNRA